MWPHVVARNWGKLVPLIAPRCKQRAPLQGLMSKEVRVMEYDIYNY